MLEKQGRGGKLRRLTWFENTVCCLKIKHFHGFRVSPMRHDDWSEDCHCKAGMFEIPEHEHSLEEKTQ